MLEIIFAVLQTLWKHHKSKDQTILHRSYTQKKFSAPKKYFFRARRKKFRKKVGRKKFRKKIDLKNVETRKCQKCQKSIFDIFDIFEFQHFSDRFFFEIFFGQLFFEIFFVELEKNIFSELRIFFGYSFDVKLSDLSIYDVFRAFGVRQIWFPAPTRYCEGTKTCSISRVFWILVRIDRFRRYFDVFKKKYQNFWTAKKHIFFEVEKKIGV